MYAGKLRHRLRVELVEGEQNSYGEPIDGEHTDVIAEVWGEVVPLSGTELVEARQVTAEVTHRVTLRYGVDVDSRHRLIHRERTLEILTVLDKDERRRELLLACKEQI